VATKGNKSRELALHESTAAALADYVRLRDQTFPTASSPSFFVSTTGHRLSKSTLHATFRLLVQETGLEPAPSSRARRPRPHDVRHSFAVSTLVAWYRAGEDVQAKLPTLSAFMGHVEPKDTYWYLSAVPELLAIASNRAQERTEPRR
jgi:integrase